jgi:hypothetical protein
LLTSTKKTIAMTRTSTPTSTNVLYAFRVYATQDLGGPHTLIFAEVLPSITVEKFVEALRRQNLLSLSQTPDVGLPADGCITWLNPSQPLMSQLSPWKVAAIICLQ